MIKVSIKGCVVCEPNQWGKRGELYLGLTRKADMFCLTKTGQKLRFDSAKFDPTWGSIKFTSADNSAEYEIDNVRSTIIGKTMFWSTRNWRALGEDQGKFKSEVQKQGLKLLILPTWVCKFVAEFVR